MPQDRKANRLTAKQATFVAEYPKDLNATAAALRAGCSKKSARVTASKWLTKANIQQAIAEAMKRRAASAEIDAGWVLQRLIKNHNRAAAANKYSDVNRALELIGRHTGGFSEKHEHSGPKGGPIPVKHDITDAERLAGLRALAARVGARSLGSAGERFANAN